MASIVIDAPEREAGTCPSGCAIASAILFASPVPESEGPGGTLNLIKPSRTRGHLPARLRNPEAANEALLVCRIVGQFHFKQVASGAGRCVREGEIADAAGRERVL